MSSVINKLLLLARSDDGKEPVTIQEVNLKDMFTELSSDVEALARDKGLQFNLGQVDDLAIKGDKIKLRQLFLNIMENAVRYTPKGGSISGSVVRRRDSAVVTVSDTGIGIPPEHLPFIFERFYRVDKARSRAEGGSGLGLAIARYIAKVHGGTIEVESETGKGSSFHVILPLATTGTA
jgi:signal transduction histidine kinase